MKSHLQLNSTLFRSALEQTPASIVITDRDGKIIYVNKFFTELTGYSMDELLGENPRILKSGYQSDELYKQLWSTIESGKTWKGELLNKKKDGSLYWEKATIKPVLNEADEVVNYIAVKQDVTEDKERLQSSERRERILNSIEQLSNTGGWEYDVAEGEFFWSEELYRIHGFEKRNIKEHDKESLKCYPPEAQKRV
ncbi:PAS domain-containing protein [Rhodohalobacter halophilus]|uniref:PAS domain-containing protein n=1 Tax=Rhodohalobacter halophilus TaxID=1812810 RepID=UPI00083F710D|nr:PAS domain S-box protein [Rhodohalobacter halophilus]